MSEYLPHSGQHSIQEAQVALHFQQGFDQQHIALARDTAESVLKCDLPRVVEMRQGALTVNMSNPDEPVPMPTEPTQLAGFELAKIQGNGTAARSLRLLNNLLSISIFDYERWEAMRRDSVRYLRSVLSLLPLNANPVMALSLQFVDRYAFNGTLENANARLLLNDGNQYVAEHCFSAGPLWHCHTGWFDDHANGRILNHLNISSTVVDLSPTVTIDHNAVFQFGSPRQTVDSLFNSPSDDTAGLCPVLDKLHDSNKAILTALLTQEMQSRIGLQLP